MKRWLVTFAVLAGVQFIQAHEVGTRQAIAPAESLGSASEYLNRYRMTGNEAWLDAVEPIDFDSADAILLKAWHAQAKHSFREASEVLRPLLSSGRADAATWLLAANLDRIVGEYEAARAACRRAMDRQLLLGTLCSAQVELSEGEQVDTAQLEALVGLQTTQDPVLNAWMLGILADAHNAQGDTQSALSRAQQAMDAFPSVQNRAQTAQLHLVLGDYDAALEVIGNDVRAPSLAVLQVRALLGAGRSAEAEIERLLASFEHDLRHGDYLHAREMAQFYFHVMQEPDLARHLALENWQRQKEPEDRELLSKFELL